jgi:putative SOS response-associated peptidase YedK
MCGRFTLASPAEILAALFAVPGLGDEDAPRYNIAPRTRVATVRGRPGARFAQSLLWGALHPRDSHPLINARSETVATSPIFGEAFAAARVLVPADGFFEWTREGAKRHAHYFHQRDGKPFAFAGIAVNPPSTREAGEPAAVILTAAASDSVKAIHGRMPLVVSPADFDLWLDPGAKPKNVHEAMARGGETEWIHHPVGPAVNNVRHDSPENVRLAEPSPDRQGSLF